jgi:DNA-binding GntR family transcriptional regulator
VERRAAARSLELVHAPEADDRSVRDSAASRVADALRARVMAGELLPGARLSQERVQEAMGVSRSTLREALQLLIRERLLVHELSRGVFVRRLSLDDVADLYRARRIVECAALRAVDTMTPAGLRRLRAAIDDGRQAAAAEEWGQVAAASIRFHEALVALAGSPRLDTLVSGVLAEFRLAYGLMDDTQAFHVRFLARHEDIARAVSEGDLANAADLLDDYLRDAEREVRAHYR